MTDKTQTTKKIVPHTTKEGSREHVLYYILRNGKAETRCSEKDCEKNKVQNHKQRGWGMMDKIQTTELQREHNKPFFVCSSCGKYNDFLEGHKEGDEVMCFRCGETFTLTQETK